MPFVPVREARSDQRSVLAPEALGVSLGPRMAFEPREVGAARRIERPFPPLRAHRFTDAFVDARSSSVLLGAEHVLSDWAFDHLAHGRVKGSSVLLQARDQVLHRLPVDPPVVDRGIHLGGYHCQNWYHWIAEILPRLSLLDRLPQEWRESPLLVPPRALAPGTFREVFEALAGDHPTHPLDESQPTLVRDLVVIDDLILHTPGFGTGSGPRTELELMNLPAMQRYRELLRAELGLEDRIEPGLRIFIDRQHDPERSYNRDEIIDVARAQGFRTILAERLSLREQAELFARAEVVVGANGAGWTNVIFSSPGARGLCWLVRDGLGGPWFRNLGLLSGVELSYLEVEPRGEGNPLKVDYWVDPERFADALSEAVTGW